MINNSVRCEYDAWSIITDCFLYEETKLKEHLEVADVKFERLVKYTNETGGLMFGSESSKVWIGENGLAVWGALRLYKYSGNIKYLVQSQKWLKYVLKNPPKVHSDEPRLYPVFLAWINYGLMMAVKLKIKGWETYLKVYEENVKIILSLMKRGTHWSICFHYDLYVGRSLLYAYHFFTIGQRNVKLGTECLVALTKFMKATRHSKIPFMNVRPIHYLFFDVFGSGYSTSQYAQLRYELYLTYFNIDDYLEGKISLDACKKYLVKDVDQVVKRFGDKVSNELATDWLRYVRALDSKCSKEALEWI